MAIIDFDPFRFDLFPPDGIRQDTLNKKVKELSQETLCLQKSKTSMG